MPWTIYRYILRELLKLLVISTAVLVTVISFTAAIKPLSEGMLGPAALVKFVFYSAPTMLGFVLPFAGAFASTLVFLRLASDNEIVACSAGGMSYFTILVPIFLLGLALTMGLFTLSNFVTPDFYRRAAQTVESDLMAIMVAQLNQNRPFVVDGAVLYADSAEERDVTPELAAVIDSPFAPTQFVRMTGVAVGFLDDEGRIRSDLTARLATVLLYHGENRSWVTIHLEHAMEYDAVRGRLVSTAELDMDPVRLPAPFRQRPKFLSWPQLRRLRYHPERFDDVGQATREVRLAISAERLRQLIRDALNSPEASGQLAMRGTYQEATFLIRAPGLGRGRNPLQLESVGVDPVVVEYEASGMLRRIESTSASMKVVHGVGDPEPYVVLELHEARVFGARSDGPATEHSALTLPRLVWPDRVVGDLLLSTGAFEWLSVASAPRYAKSAVRRARDLLAREIRELAHKIEAQLHERAASAVACLLLLLLGALLSIRLKGQMPLVVYFWSFMLAIVTLVIIYTGANMAGGLDFPLGLGLAVMWFGNVILIGVLGAVYYRLARN